MLITPADLKAQYERAIKAWPFFHEVERNHGIPAFLLLAVGSRETNLTNEHGDGGHGRGIFQLDDRWHKIPADFDSNVREQARTAAEMLAANLKHYGGSVLPAVCAYNAGIGNVDAGIQDHNNPDQFTTHSGAVGYGQEVVDRWKWLTANCKPPAKPAKKTTTKPAPLTPAQRGAFRRLIVMLRRMLGQK